MTHKDLDLLRTELSIKAKNGLDFILSATIIWFAIAYVWTWPNSAYDNSVLTFITGSFMLPLTMLFSKLFKTQWKIKNNPLQPLGLWLNFAQLFYFPILIFVLLKHPDYFIMTYMIITGAHFFPYAWYYNEKAYAIFAGIISVGGLLLALYLPLEKMHLIGVFMGICLSILAFLLFLSFKKKKALTLNTCL